MFMFDIETLGTESNSVLLSAAIIHFDTDDSESIDLSAKYKELMDRSCFVKFNAKEQINKYNRNVSKGTLDWWSKQAEIPRKLALDPSPNDLIAIDGIETLRNYIKENGGTDQLIWARGSLDQVVVDSLARAVGVDTLVAYNNWRDVRTAVDILASDGKNGYCSIPGFNADVWVTKHDPRADCALDIMMLLYHK